MTKTWIVHIWQVMRRFVIVPRTARITITVVGDTAMQSLNQRYRGVQSVTDVLSFAYDKQAGDIVICYPQAKRQAMVKQHSLKRECAWLVVHGLLHWLGYDHERAADAKVMRPLEQRIMQYV